MAWSRVQSTTFSGGTSSIVTPSFGSNPTAGNLLIVVIFTMGTTERTVSSVSSGTDTWQKAVSESNSSVISDIEIWYAMNCEGGASDVELFIDLSGSPSVGSEGWIAEFSGGATSSALDQEGGALSLTTPSKTPTADGDLFIAAACNFSDAVSAPGGSWSSLGVVGSGGLQGCAAYLAEGSSSETAESAAFGGTPNDPASVIAAFFAFVAPSPPSTPTGLSATVSGSNVDLSWTPGSGGGPVSSYSVLRGTSTGGETSYATGITGTTYVDTGATAGTEYFYKVEAVGAGGTSSPSTEANATVPLAAPRGLIAIGLNGAVYLSWSDPTTGNPSTYTLLRGTTSGGETSYVTGISGTANSYTDTGVTTGVQYFYKIEAVSGGTSSPSNEASATPAATTIYPAFDIQVAFGNNTFDAPLTWTSIRNWCMSLQTTSGRSRPTDRLGAGTFTASFTEAEPSGVSVGRFTPWNTSGPYYEAASTGMGLVPGKPLRIIGYDSSGNVYPVWWGYTKEWTPQIVSPILQTVKLTAGDLLDLLNLRYLANPTLFLDAVLAYSPNAFFRLGDSPVPVVGYTTGAFFTPQDSSGTGALAEIGPGSLAAIDAGAQGPILYDPSTCYDFSSGASSSTPSATLLIDPSGAGTVSSGFFQFNTSQAVAQSMCVPSLQVVGSNEVATIGINASGQFQLTFGPAGSAPSVEFTGPVVADGAWHTVCWTYLTAQNLTLLLDGMVVTTFSNSNLTDNVSTWAATYVFTSPVADFAGQLANIALFPTALTVAQLQGLYEVATYFRNPESTGARITKCLLVALGTTAYNNLTLNIANGSVVCLAETAQTIQTTALAYIQNVCDTECGLFFQGPDGVVNFYQKNYPQTNSSSITSQATFGDNTSTSYHYTDGLVITRSDVTLYNDVQAMITTATNNLTQSGTPTATVAPQLYEDSNASSETEMGTRVLQRSGLIFDSPVSALALADLYTSRYAVPVDRVATLPVTAATTANVPQMLGRKIWDRVTVQRQPPGSSQFSKDSLVEQIQHSWKSDPGLWSTTWATNPYDLIVPTVTISHAGNWVGFSPTTLTVAPVTAGDLMVAWLVAPTMGISGGGVIDWYLLQQTAIDGSTYGWLYWGLVSNVGSQTLTIAGASANDVMVDEFSAGTAIANWMADVSNVGTGTPGPTLTPTTSLGELGYFAFYGSGLSAGSTSGYTYETSSSVGVVAYNLDVIAATAAGCGGTPAINAGVLFQAVV